MKQALISLLLFFAAPLSAADVSVFAAASLRDALSEIAAEFESDTGHSVTLTFAGSATLARQIGQGAPADVFISANSAWMDVLEDQKVLVPGSRRDLLGNQLVLIGTDEHPVEISPDLDLAGLIGDGVIAMGIVNAVPAGIYGKAALETLDLWDDVQSIVAQTDNVRAALALVSLGEAKLGIVYRSDALADPSVAILGIFPEASHPTITYPIARIVDRENPAADEFVESLSSTFAMSVFEAQGFEVPE